MDNEESVLHYPLSIFLNLFDTPICLDTLHGKIIKV